MTLESLDGKLKKKLTQTSSLSVKKFQKCAIKEFLKLNIDDKVLHVKL